MRGQMKPRLEEFQLALAADVRELLEHLGFQSFPLIPQPKNFYWDFKVVFPSESQLLLSGDGTNFLKAIEDALTGLVWPDDSPKYLRSFNGWSLSTRKDDKTKEAGIYLSFWGNVKETQ